MPTTGQTTEWNEPHDLLFLAETVQCASKAVYLDLEVRYHSLVIEGFRTVWIHPDYQYLK